MEKPIVIFGSAEMAQMANYYFTHDSNHKIAAFTVDDDFVDRNVFDGLPLVAFSDALKFYPPREYDMHVALSYSKLNQLRQQKYLQAKMAGYVLRSYICSRSVLWPDLTIGDNCFVLESQVIQPNVRIGNNVMIWSGNHIGHGTQIFDHVYIASHVVISGHCTIGERSFLGVNSAIKDFCSIGRDCFVGMGASVTRDMDIGSIALGEAAHIYDQNDRRARALRRAFFG